MSNHDARMSLQPTEAGSSTPVFTDYVLEPLHGWLSEGARCALVTVIGIEGGAPRPVGAQMAVAEDGRAAGYISGGCLEGALVAEAQLAITEGRNRLVRYGSGSPYIDVRLPCGSGLDIYVDQILPLQHASEMLSLWRQRVPFYTKTDLASGASVIVPMAGRTGREPSRREDDMFIRVTWPQIRLVIVGAGPAAGFLARLAADIGWQVELCAPELSGLGLAALPGISVRELYAADLERSVTGDAWSAAAVVFHDHEWEMPVLTALLGTDCFYIGAVGSRKVHGLRVAALKQQGFGEDAIARIHGPAGLIGQTKSPATLALSILAEIVAAARDRDITP
jgi:xanthine dehydrogenase accessory factor